MTIKWKYLPVDGTMKETYEIPDKCLIVHYVTGWTIIYPRELSGHKSEDVEVLRAQVEHHFRNIV